MYLYFFEGGGGGLAFFCQKTWGVAYTRGRRTVRVHVHIFNVQLQKLQALCGTLCRKYPTVAGDTKQKMHEVEKN